MRMKIYDDHLANQFYLKVYHSLITPIIYDVHFRGDSIPEHGIDFAEREDGGKQTANVIRICPLSPLMLNLDRMHYP
jgi:hypothetical protein